MAARTGWALALGLALCCTGGAGALTAAPPGTGDRVLKSFADCRAIADPAGRLACFDKAAASLEAAVQARDVRIVDRQDIRTARRSLFGFTVPRISLFGGGDGKGDAGEEEFTEINATVASARGVENGRIEFGLSGDEGTWRTTDPMSFPPRPGAKVRIRKGAMGNYFVSFAGERSVRGMRVR